MTTKSGTMVGLGETEEDVLNLIDDLRQPNVDCQILTIGQYLSPRNKAIPIHEYIHPDTFERYRIAGLKSGFAHVYAGPFVRSSYNAHEALLAAHETKIYPTGDPERWLVMTEDMSGKNIAIGPKRIPIYP